MDLDFLWCLEGRLYLYIKKVNTYCKGTSLLGSQIIIVALDIRTLVSGLERCRLSFSLKSQNHLGQGDVE